VSASILIEGYASLFGMADDIGDTVRPGAFARTLRRRSSVPMLLQHRNGAIAGQWTRMVEDGRGLVEAPHAQALIHRGLNGLSIGFRARLAKARASGGRDLIDLDLVEVSLVANPMQPAARFTYPAIARSAA